MDELTDEQVARLLKDANSANIIRSFCSHDGFKLYKNALEEILLDKKHKWLSGTDDEARTERIRAQGIQKALDVLKQFMLLGDNANRILNEMSPNKTL